MDKIAYNFDEFPARLKTRIQKIAAQRKCSVDNVVRGLWDSFLAMVESGKPELTGFAKEIQEARRLAKAKPSKKKAARPTKPKGKK